MPGSVTNAFPVHHVFTGSKETAVAANDIIGRMVVPFKGRIRGVKVNAGGAAVGAGNTIIDLRINGTTVWTAGADRPTLATASTGEFTNPAPNVQAVAAGDVLTWFVVSIPATSGHTLVGAGAAIELA